MKQKSFNIRCRKEDEARFQPATGRTSGTFKSEAFIPEWCVHCIPHRLHRNKDRLQAVLALEREGFEPSKA